VHAPIRAGLTALIRYARRDTQGLGRRRHVTRRSARVTTTSNVTVEPTTECDCDAIMPAPSSGSIEWATASAPNHTLLVHSDDVNFKQLEMFVRFIDSTQTRVPSPRRCERTFNGRKAAINASALW
jgi:hypothetical protein